MPHAPDLCGCALDGRYELHVLIGEGAFGRVYAGRDRRLARPVAVKVIKPWWSEDPTWVTTFEREAQLLARLSDPGIVQIFDVGHAPEGLYYVAELVEGENLAARLRGGPLGVWEAGDVATQLCRALSRAHAERIVHRDVKPANILLTQAGAVKVGDFGVAHLAEGSTEPSAVSIVGTPRYMAPEQGRGLRTSPATDVYSVGVVLFEMLTGSVPFDARSAVELALLHLEQAPPPLPADIPPELADIVTRALAKEPARRFADGGEMADALLMARPRSRRTAASRVQADGYRRPLAAVGAPGAGRGALLTGPPADPPEEPLRGARSPIHDTRPAPRMSPRRNVNPPARRRAMLALGSVFVLLAAMAAAAAILAPAAHTRVPRLMDLTRAQVVTRARQAHLRPVMAARYSARVPAGLTVSQRPSPGGWLPDGALVAVTVSRGPSPVKLPAVVGDSARDAEHSLASLGLRPVARTVPAPGTAPGTVTAQRPAAGVTAAVGARIALDVADVPSYHAVTTFTGADSGAVHITGQRWRIAYRMSFDGMCSWIFFCSGPTARVVDLSDGATVARFGLADGGGENRSFATGSGDYEIRVRPGGDTASWAISVQDLY